MSWSPRTFRGSWPSLDSLLLIGRSLRSDVADGRIVDRLGVADGVEREALGEGDECLGEPVSIDGPGHTGVFVTGPQGAGERVAKADLPPRTARDSYRTDERMLSPTLGQVACSSTHPGTLVGW